MKKKSIKYNGWRLTPLTNKDICGQALLGRSGHICKLVYGPLCSYQKHKETADFIHQIAISFIADYHSRLAPFGLPIVDNFQAMLHSYLKRYILGNPDNIAESVFSCVYHEVNRIQYR
jgi:hypothetical protein